MRLGVSRPTAYRLVRDRAIPAIRLRGAIRVPIAALESWLEGQERSALAAVALVDETSPETRTPGLTGLVGARDDRHDSG